MSALTLCQGIVERFPNRIVHHDEIGIRDQSHEARHEPTVALYPMINAGIPVLQLLGSDVRNHIFGQSVELCRKIFLGHSNSLPGKSGCVAFSTFDGDLQAACKRKKGEAYPCDYVALSVPNRNFHS